MPRAPRKTNQLSTWFNGVLRETKQGDIFEDKTATATMDTVESLYPRLPSENGSEIEMNMTEAGGGGNSPTPELQLILQRLEQMEQDKQALEPKLGAVSAKVISGEVNEDTYEKLGKLETALMEKAPQYVGNPKEVFTWCEKFENHLSNNGWQTIPSKGIKKCCWDVSQEGLDRR